MKLMIHDLPNPPSESEREYRVLRHWLTTDDGELYYQDETLRYAYPDPEDKQWSSDRGPWFKLPVPESADVVVSSCWSEAEGCVLVFMRSGKVYQFTTRNGDRIPHFYEVIEAVPDTLAEIAGRHRQTVQGEIHGS